MSGFYAFQRTKLVQQKEEENIPPPIQIRNQTLYVARLTAFKLKVEHNNSEKCQKIYLDEIQKENFQQK